MSRKGKKRDERQKATNSPAEPRAPKPRRCDDELTELAEQMRPGHHRFALGVLAGQTGAKAAIAAGFSPASARSIAYRLLRREDVRRYIRLGQREQAVGARVTLEALVERLWRTTTNSNASSREREQALKHLVRIMVARHRGDVDDAGSEVDGELTDARVEAIEAKVLGVIKR